MTTPVTTDAPVPIKNLAVTADGHSVSRNLGYRFGQVVDVKDFGAIGNGSTNDRAAIQAAFDYAFGTWADPHGGLLDAGSDLYLNKRVFFPLGNYNVLSLIDNRAITSAISAGDNFWGAGVHQVKLNVSTTGLLTGDNINVVGVGGIPGANGSYFIDVISPTQLLLRFSVFKTATDAYTSGGTITTPGLRLRSVANGWIYGAGRQTIINSGTLNAAAICTSGCAYTRFENLSFSARPASAGGKGIAFQLDRMAVDTEAVNLQSNTFFCCSFSGGDFGLKIGAGQSMGSETMILQCYFDDHTVAGIYTGNQNACDNTVIGGNIAHCGKGIWALAGSVNTIHAVSLQANVTHDLHVEGAVGDGYSICGCRSESINFVQLDPMMPMHISGCNQTRVESGFFFKGSGHVTFAGCDSVNGYVEGNNAYILIGGCNFQRPDYLTAGSDNYASLNILPMPVTTQTGTTYSIGGYDASSKVRFNNAAATTVTVQNNADTTTRLIAGNKIEVQQVGAGQVTFVGAAGVTIRATPTLKLRAQYSVATLTCDGPNLWTLAGDLATS